MARQSRSRLPTVAFVIAIGVLTLTAAPTAIAGQPGRYIHGPGEDEFIPAGLGCAFDVLWQKPDEARITYTWFDDGRLVIVTNATPTLINLDTGATFLHRARYHLVETYDAATNEYVDDLNGSYISQFYPGDAGPLGVVLEPVMYRFTGSFHSTTNADSFETTSFTYKGQFTDVCAALAS